MSILCQYLVNTLSTSDKFVLSWHCHQIMTSIFSIETSFHCQYDKLRLSLWQPIFVILTTLGFHLWHLTSNLSKVTSLGHHDKCWLFYGCHKIRIINLSLETNFLCHYDNFLLSLWQVWFVILTSLGCYLLRLTPQKYCICYY